LRSVWSVEGGGEASLDSDQACLSNTPHIGREREGESFIDNLLVPIHLIVDIIFVDRPCAMAF